ncbi:MAG: hypothetical protein WC683_00980 [bacterium]
MKFRKRPVVIEAVQWDGFNLVEVQAFCPTARVVGPYNDGKLLIPTLEGDHYAGPMDFIIRGVAGEFYPCKEDIFAQTYEPVDGIEEAIASDRRIPPILRRDVITVRDLKQWVQGLAEVNAVGDDTEVWIATEDGRHSNPCRELSPLNVRDRDTAEASCDILLIWR